MRGSYRGEERKAVREDFRVNHIPEFIDNEVRPLARFIDNKQSIVAIDGGPNKGFWSKALLEIYYDRVEKIYMIDASGENYSELVNTEDSLLFDDRDFVKLKPIHCALSDSVGTIDFYTDEDGSPISSMYPHKVADENTLFEMGDLTKIVKVPCDTLDNVIAREKVEHIDILKLDIEGNEFKALLGAEKTISGGNVDVIMYEFGIHQVDARNFFRDFYEFFKRYGYKTYKIVGPHAHHIPQYSYHHENFSTCWNFVASRL